MRSAQELVSPCVGVVALRQTVDTDTGEAVEDSVVLARYGGLPAKFDAG